MATLTTTRPATLPRARAGRLAVPAFVALCGTFVAARVWQFAAATTTARPDSADYLALARLAPIDGRIWGGARPPLLPLAYGALGGDPTRIVVAQLLVALMAWGGLAWVVWRALPGWAGLAGAALVLGTACTTPVALWDRLLLSESLALSLGAALLALGIALHRRWHLAAALTFVAVAAAWALVRDSDAFALPLVALIALGAAIARRMPWHRALPLALALLLVCVGANASATYGERWLFPALDVTTMRVLPNPAARASFVAAGMPDSPALEARAGRWASDDDNAILRDPALADFRAWVQARWRAVYARYVLTHPRESVGALLAPESLVRLLAPPLGAYRPEGYAPLVGGALDAALAPGVLGTLALLAVALGATAWRRRLGPLTLPTLAATVIALPLLALTWHADAMEVGRHALGAAVLLRLGCWLLLAAMLAQPSTPACRQSSTAGSPCRLLRWGRALRSPRHSSQA